MRNAQVKKAMAVLAVTCKNLMEQMDIMQNMMANLDKRLAKIETQPLSNNKGEANE